MSRVHDALRKAEGVLKGAAAPPGAGLNRLPASGAAEFGRLDVSSILQKIQTAPFTLSPDASLIDAQKPQQAPMEEFRSLRTRLNHLQSLQPIHSVLVTSASPAEGKSFTAANLALVQAQLDKNLTLLCDFDFRRPVMHTLFGLHRSPGVTDYLQGKVEVEDVIKRIEGTNLFVMPAGEAVLNPLELLNLPEAKNLLEALPQVFNWVVLDSPPLLFAADANLISTMCHGTVMVVRLGSTTIDSITRAIQSLCQNNILGIVVNCAQKSELYHKYTYYHSYYYSRPEDTPAAEPVTSEEAPASSEDAQSQSEEASSSPA